MHNPIHLPRELFDQVLDEASDDLTDVKLLYNLALVSRRWHPVTAPRLYSKWTYFGETHSHRSLLCYLRTLMQNPQLAARVRTLDVRNWWHYSEDYSDAEQPDYEYSEEEVVMIRTALRDAHFADPGWDGYVNEALEKKQRRLLMALVFTRLPKLEKLYAHLSRKDRFLNKILQVATDKERDGSAFVAFQFLKEAFLMGETYHSHKSWIHIHTIGLDEAAPFFLLPSIENLAVLELDDLSPYYSFDERSLPLKRLTIDGAGHHVMICLQRLMQAFAGLQSFTMHGERSEGVTSRCMNSFHGDIGDALRLQKETLEHIDIRLTKAFCVAKQRLDPDTHVLGSLSDFPRLKSLFVQPKVLLGGGNGKPLAPYRLVNALPQSIESLCFIIEREMGTVNMEWAEQLLELLDLHSHSFPNLKSIVVQMLGLSDAEAMPSIEEVQRACRGRGVAFRFRDDVADWRDGSCFDYFREGEMMRDDREEREWIKKVEEQDRLIDW